MQRITQELRHFDATTPPGGCSLRASPASGTLPVERGPGARRTHWHAQVEIEHRPDLSARHRAALATVHGTTGRDDPAFWLGMDQLAAVEAEAVRAAVSA
ncbi:hypothetical protein RFN58_04635 [Streptomyces iakyrus]|uniref:hypothetical protein n=1 Tax=Streptomyces iakyrus TaxID=68219 RepID=UPI00052559F5|nr:hypothetical protein [Streptomyces iakyrus]